MPKIIDLPEATDVNPEDVLFIDDIGSAQSKKIQVQNFNKEINKKNLLSGTAGSGNVITMIPGDITQFISNYEFSFGNDADKVTGFINNTSPLGVFISGQIRFVQDSTSQAAGALVLIVEFSNADNTGIVTGEISEQWLVGTEQVDFIMAFTASILPAQFGLTTQSRIRFGLESRNKTISGIIASTNFTVENI